MHLHHSSFELKTFHSNAKYSLYITVCMSSVTFRENRDQQKGCKFSPTNIFHISKSHFVWTRKRIDSSLTRSLEGCVWRKRSSVMMHMKGIWLLSVLSTFLLQFYLFSSKSEILTLLFLSLSHSLSFLLCHCLSPSLILSHIPRQFNPWKQQIFQHVSYKLFMMMMITIKNSSLRLESLFRQEWIALLMFVWKSSHWRRKWVNSQRESQSAWILHGRWFVPNLDMRERWESGRRESGRRESGRKMRVRERFF